MQKSTAPWDNKPQTCRSPYYKHNHNWNPRGSLDLRHWEQIHCPKGANTALWHEREPATGFYFLLFILLINLEVKEGFEHISRHIWICHEKEMKIRYPQYKKKKKRHSTIFRDIVLNNILKPFLKRKIFKNNAPSSKAAGCKTPKPISVDSRYWFKLVPAEKHIETSVSRRARKKCNLKVLLLQYLYKIYPNNLWLSVYNQILIIRAFSTIHWKTPQSSNNY